MKNKTFIIGISGASGSGKSTFSQQLEKLLPSCYYLSIDKYYKKELPKITSPMDGKEYPDWNHPDAIDSKGAVEEIKEASDSGYRYIIVDGAFIFCIPELDNILNYRIYIDASIEMRIYRRIKRNVVLKGQTFEQIGEYYLKTVRYREKQYSLPSAAKADIRIDNEINFSIKPQEISNLLMNIQK